MAWEARIEFNNKKAEKLVIEVCNNIKSRIPFFYDKRLKEIITDGLNWAINNIEKIGYNVREKDLKISISPNLVGFQLVLQGISYRVGTKEREVNKIIVDQQQQFNAGQHNLFNIYQRIKDTNIPIGINLPNMELSNLPDTPMEIRSNSIGLELVDIYLWIYGRILEGKSLDNNFHELFNFNNEKGIINDISIDGILKRATDFLSELPELSDLTNKEIISARELIDVDEARRKKHIALSE